MSNPTKRIKYSDFMKLTPDQRLIQSEYFRKNKPTMIPVIIFTKSVDLPQLPNCKFLMSKDKQLYGELNQLRLFVQKNSQQKGNTKNDAFFFQHNGKVLAGNLKVVDFLSKSYKDAKGDGWLHIQYYQQGSFGNV